MSHLVLGFLLLLVLVFPSGAPISGASASNESAVLSDDFNDNTINPSIWTVRVNGTGPVIAETNQRLEVSLPANSVNGPGGYFSAGYKGVCVLRGDFDVQVDYQLLTWPTANGVRVGLSFGFAESRVSFGNSSDFPGRPREEYVTHFNDGVLGVVTSDSAGTLRLVRSGSAATGFYFSAGSWATIHTGTVTSADVSFEIAAWSHDYAFTDQAVKIAFDNFIINQGQLVCPVSGRITQGPETPIIGATVSASSGQQALTDSNGYYAITGVPEGTHTLTAAKSGYVFSPATITVTVGPDATSKNFYGRTTARFLDLPISCVAPYCDKALVYGKGGYVMSVFDHKYPKADYEDPATTGTVVQYDGGEYVSGWEQNQRPYSHHGGYDFDTHIDNMPGDQDYVRYARAAAGGRVAGVYWDCQQSCRGGVCCDGSGWGNWVQVDHGNGYNTLYAHLAYGTVRVQKNDWVSSGVALGDIGTTGDSNINHLHLEVFAWVAPGEWRRVDPYGWDPIPGSDYWNQPDPWAVHTQGAPSSWLWIAPHANQSTYLSTAGTLIQDPAAFANSITIAGTSNTGSARASASNPPVAPAQGSMRSLDRFFRLVLELLPDAGAQAVEQGRIAAPDSYSPTVTITMPYSETNTLHLNPEQLAIHHWDSVKKQWQPLVNTIDPVNHNVMAVTTVTGDFDLQAPLLCPADDREPDDDFEHATSLSVNDPPMSRLLDLEGDIDWARFSALAGVEYVLRTQNLTAGTDTVLSILESDGATLLATNDDSGEAPSSELAWRAPRTGSFYARVTSAPGGETGCSAGYELVLAANPPTGTYLPLLMRGWNYSNGITDPR